MYGSSSNSYPASSSSSAHPLSRPYDHDLSATASSSDSASGGGLLSELDKLAPLRTFDAFPKVQTTYREKSVRGGLITFAIAWTIFLLVLNDWSEYVFGESNYSFAVDKEIGKDIQLNIDMTVNMPCEYLSIDLRDAVGDRVFLSNDFVKDGTTFDTAHTSHFQSSTNLAPSASTILQQVRKRRSGPGIWGLFTGGGKDDKLRRALSMYRKTRNVVPDGPACRVYGSVEVKKVTANLHVTTMGHGYMSYQHTPHEALNLSHIIHEFSFGPFYPSISQPLDMSIEITDQPFSIFQYFLQVVPTTFIDSSNRRVSTNQYSVTDYVRHVEHGRGVPGVFFKFDLDAIALTIHERTSTFYQFFVRLIGVIGGVWTCTSFSLRAIARLEANVRRAKKGKARADPSSGVLGGGGRMGARRTSGFM